MITRLGQEGLQAAYNGSYYTILGCGEPISGWIEGYEAELAKEGVGVPAEWFIATGAEVNKFMFRDLPPTAWPEREKFKDDLTILLFPLDGLNLGVLAIFKLTMGDRWFDDIVDNTRRFAGCAS